MMDIPAGMSEPKFVVSLFFFMGRIVLLTGLPVKYVINENREVYLPKTFPR